MPTMTLGEYNRILLLASLTTVGGARISGDAAAAYLMRCPPLPPSLARPSS